MWRFLLGLVVGATGGFLVGRTRNAEALEKHLAEMQERASAVLAESRRVLEETRQELRAALEAWRRSLGGEQGGGREGGGRSGQAPEEPCGHQGQGPTS